MESLTVVQDSRPISHVSEPRYDIGSRYRRQNATVSQRSADVEAITNEMWPGVVVGQEPRPHEHYPLYLRRLPACSHGISVLKSRLEQSRVVSLIVNLNMFLIIITYCP